MLGAYDSKGRSLNLEVWLYRRLQWRRKDVKKTNKKVKNQSSDQEFIYLVDIW